MIEVTDLSPGTVLRTMQTERTVRVQALDQDFVVLATSDGQSMTVDRHELQADVAAGRVGVIS